MRLALATFFPLVLAACQPFPEPAPPPFPGPAPRLPPQPEPPMPGDTCGAAQWQHLVGGPVPQPFPVTGNVRIIPEGVAATMDYDARRLNVTTDRERRTILSIHCG